MDQQLGTLNCQRNVSRHTTHDLVLRKLVVSIALLSLARNLGPPAEKTQCFSESDILVK